MLVLKLIPLSISEYTVDVTKSLMLSRVSKLLEFCTTPSTIALQSGRSVHPMWGKNANSAQYSRVSFIIVLSARNRSG